MNDKRRKMLNDAFEEFQVLLREERESVNCREEDFSLSDEWKESKRILDEAEDHLESLEGNLMEWEVR